MVIIEMASGFLQTNLIRMRSDYSIYTSRASDLKDFTCTVGLYPFFFFSSFCSCFFFYESQALHRQLCSGICYFLVTLVVLHMLFFGVFASNYALFLGGQTSKNAFNRQQCNILLIFYV